MIVSFYHESVWGHRWNITNGCSGGSSDNAIADLHLSRGGEEGGYLLHILGRSGEALMPNTAITLRLRHRLVDGVTLTFALRTGAARLR
jgi:hypothetical protein